MHLLLRIALFFDRGAHYMWYGPIHYQVPLIVTWLGLFSLAGYLYTVMGAVGTWEKLLGTFVTDAMITVAACITAVSGTFTVAAGVAQPEPSHETARRGRADSSAADEGKDGEEPQAHGAASTSRSARSPLLMSRASRRSSASPGRRALQRHAMSGRHGPYPLLTPSARSLTPVASIANGKATGWWGTTSLTMLTVLFAICVAASVTCDMLTFSSAATEQSSHPLVWIPYVVGDLFDDVSTCGCYIYLALVAWALRTRARRLLVAVQGGLEDEAYGVALTSTQLKQAQSDSNEALENYLGLHEAVEATSRRASLLPFVLIVVGVIENAAMVSALFQKSEDVDSTSHDEAPASVLVCMIRLYTVISSLVIVLLSMAGQLAEMGEELALAATRRAARTAHELREVSSSVGGEAAAARKHELELELAGWDRLSQTCRSQPLALRSGGLKLSSEVAGSVTLALITLGLAIVGIRLPEM